jgi:DNA-binding response OmpR family regulator
VDDEPLIINFISRVLQKDGYAVDVADQADKAINLLKTKEYDVILLDIKMPDMDGIELYYYMKNLSESLVNRVIFITGDVMSVDTHRFLEKTNSVYIPKPFDADALREVVRKRLSGR